MTKEKVSLSTLNEWTCTVKSLLKRKIERLKNMRQKNTKKGTFLEIVNSKRL